MNFLSELFCRHKWKSHAKQEYISESLERNFLGAYEKTGGKTIYTKEVLICSNCGKIKTIKY